MLGKLSFNRTFHLLENTINIAHQRHNLSSSNISNLDTHNKKGMDIDFKTAMARALGSEHELHLNRTQSGHIGTNMVGAQQIEPFEGNLSAIKSTRQMEVKALERGGNI